METSIIYVAVTFLLGTLATLVRLPPLVGFLAAGFVVTAAGVEKMPGLDIVAEWGVAMLMFTIGLKLDFRALLRKEAWGTSLPHMVFSTLIGAGFLGLLSLAGSRMLAGAGAGTLVLLGFALSFSSTVFAAKVLEERSEDGSLYGRTALAILVIQDVFAVGFLTGAAEHLPDPKVLLLVGLWPVTVLFRRLWRSVGRGELQVLFGVAVALVPGYWLFTWVGLTGELGALVMGLLLAPSVRAGTLAASLFSIKEILLVGFFVAIGVESDLTGQAVLMGLVLLLLLPAQGLLYVLLQRMFGLRNRTAVLSGVILTTFSEFGLIVAAYAVARGLLEQVWLPALSVAVAGSFVVAAVVNRRGAGLVDRFAEALPVQATGRLMPEDRPVALGDVRAIVLGMGRIGAAAYDQLRHVYGLSAVGVENNLERAAVLQARGVHVLAADATDSEFWQRLHPSHLVEIIVLAMPEHGSNLYALEQVEASEFDGTVAVVARNDDDVREVRSLGIDAVLHLYEGAGESLADRAATYAGIRPIEGQG
ncbi:Predicted Kef-type K+ transport protein, K+/H+ antiporter domain [Raineyella antarctica]|uniref:Predicted Kef-type K+ transport protein, K+/H+ antiporter domain n=1 Tax=Raineyella antarctica TaxID=1577474 RepID=A0A1G6H7Q4_9ACTN|nr:cation:proton antiporter family protein [Raineyella antarctica]SDB90138.1 Predicted Kef-type K+ transport protein, K+/H+ antiporter domain [Raineyella antarctica]